MYDLSGVWINGEHIIFDDAHLRTQEGMEADTWTVLLDGAHMLRHDVNERVTLKMATGDGHEVEGEARVTYPGHHDERRRSTTA